AASTSFSGDYETGDTSQWGPWPVQWVPGQPQSCCFNIVTNPVRQGRYAAQFIVSQGFSPFGWNESTEIGSNFSDQGQGSDYYYTFSLLFPQGWTDPHGWGLVEQFYSKNYSAFWGPAPIAIDASVNRLGLNINTGLSPITGGPNFQWEYSHY